MSDEACIKTEPVEEQNASVEAPFRYELELEIGDTLLQPMDSRFAPREQKRDNSYDEPKHKRSRSTTRQLEQLVLMLEGNRRLALSKSSVPMISERNDNLWAEIAAKISEYGPPKTGSQLKTTWRDLKLKVRNKYAKVRQARVAPGEHAAPMLSAMDRRVLGIIGACKLAGRGEERSGGPAHERIFVEPLSWPRASEPSTVPDANVEMETRADSAGVRKITANAVDVSNATEKEILSLIRGPEACVADLCSVESTPLMTVNPISTTDRDSSMPTPTEADGPTARGRTAKRNFKHMDDVAQEYAELQANANRIHAEMVATLREKNKILRETLQQMKANGEERNAILRERNEIEKEKIRLKKLQLGLS